MTTLQNFDRVKEEQIQREIFLSTEKNNKKVIDSALTSPMPEALPPELYEMGVNDISLRLPKTSAEKLEEHGDEIISCQAYVEEDQVLPESDRTTVIEIS